VTSVHSRTIFSVITEAEKWSVVNKIIMKGVQSVFLATANNYNFDV